MQMDNTDTTAKSLYAFLICSMHATCAANLTLLDLITTVKTDEEQKLCRRSLCYYFLSLTSKRTPQKLFRMNFISGFLRAVDEG